MDFLPAPFHFAATFLVTVAALGGAWVTVYRPQFVPSGSYRRLSFGMGWILLALGEILHGSQIAASERDPIVAVMAVAAYVLLVAGIQPLFRPRTTEPVIQVQPVEDSPVLVSVSPKWRPRPVAVPAVRRLVLALGLFATSQAILSAGSIDAVRPGALWWIGHGLRLMGGLAVLAWLGQVVRTSIQARVVAVFISLLLVVVVAISGSMTQVFTANITDESLRSAEREGSIQRRMLDQQLQDALSSAGQVAKLQTVRVGFANRDLIDTVLRPTVSTLQGPNGPFESYDFIVFFDPFGNLVAVSANGPAGKPTLSVTDMVALAGTDVVRRAESQQQAASLDILGSPGKIAAIGAYPVASPQGSPQGVVGVVAMGRLLNRDYLLSLRQADGEQAFLISRDKVLARTTPKSAGVLLSNSHQLDTLFTTGSRLSIKSVIGNREYFSAYVPLRRADKIIGALVVSKPSGVLGLTQRNAAPPLFFIALWATIVGVGLSLLFGKRITQPIRELTEAAEKVRKGDLTTRVIPQTMDEVGVLGEAFDQMTESLSKATHDLRDTAEQEFQLRRRLETILQSMTDGVVAVDNQGTIVAFNREAERILGYRQSEATGQNIKKILKLKDAEGNPVDPSIFELRQGAVSGIVSAFRDVSRPVVVTSAPIEDEGGVVIGGVAVVRDLTREAEIEKMKTEFLANISHELRTPITPIKGYSDLMRRKAVPREQAVTFLEGILASAERLERIVEMLVDFSAMEGGRLTPKKVPVDFDKVTSELVEKWTQTSPSHTFERKGFSNLPKVKVDRRLVPLAIGELVDNAVKFSPKGGKVVLTAECNGNGKGPRDIKVTVSDEGIGIGKEQLARIGENFVQADGSETRPYGGLGLGLAYVRRIVEGHGGRLEVDSTPDKGSCFTLVFPGSAVGQS
jgi:two-component system, OmpR family, phosphate regulon sensor histidine kinase PhoR